MLAKDTTSTKIGDTLYIRIPFEIVTDSLFPFNRDGGDNFYFEIKDKNILLKFIKKEKDEKKKD